MVKRIPRSKAIRRMRLAGIGHDNKNTTMPANGQVHGTSKRQGKYLLTTTTTSSTTTTTTA